MEANLGVIKPVFGSRERFFVYLRDARISGAFACMMDEDKGSVWECPLKEGVYDLRGGRILIVEIMDLPESVDEDNFRVYLNLTVNKGLAVFLGNHGQGDRLEKLPPHTLRGFARNPLESRNQALFGRIYFKIQDPGSVNWQAEEVLTRADRAGHVPGQGGLADGCIAPEKDNALPGDVGIKKKFRFLVDLIGQFFPADWYGEPPRPRRGQVQIYDPIKGLSRSKDAKVSDSCEAWSEMTAEPNGS